LLTGAVVAPALADERDAWEDTLKHFFEGRSVTVLIDMPATSKGIDLEVGHVEPVNPSKLGDRIADTGISIHEGQRVPITQVKVKKDLIEFHLAGGGFNWFWDTQGSVSPAVSGKSYREKELEKQIKDETDAHRRRRLEDDLDRERRIREEEERRSRRLAEEENRARHAEDHDKALLEGSRFNLRFEGKTTRDNTNPRAVMAILSRWIDFNGLPGAPVSDRPRRHDDGGDRREARHDSVVKNGMSWEDVKDRLGAPEHKDTRNDGDLRTTVAVFHDQDMRIEVTFVNGVVVKTRELDR
jgi:hypothetical protein